MWPRIRPLVLFGWTVALIRFGIDASVKPERSNPIFYIGVDVLMPIAYLVVGVKAIWDDIPWKKYPLIALTIAVLVWFIPNAIAYTTGQFLGWQHGRFHGIPIGETALGKIARGVGIGGGTAIAGTLGSLLLMTLLIWLPGKIRRKKRASAA